MSDERQDIPKELDDGDLRRAFKSWMSQAVAAAPSNARIQAIQREIEKVDRIAERLRAQTLMQLEHLDERFRPDILKDMEAGRPLRQTFGAQNATRRDSYELSRSILVADFTDRNDKLWKQRVVLAREAATVVERQQMKMHGPVGQQRPALEQFKDRRVVDANDLFSQLRAEALAAEPAPGTTRGPDRDQERE